MHRGIGDRAAPGSSLQNRQWGDSENSPPTLRLHHIHTSYSPIFSNGPHILISRSRFSLNQIRSSPIVWLPLNMRFFIGIQKLLLVLAKKRKSFMELLKYVPCLFVSKHFSLNGLKVFFHIIARHWVHSNIIPSIAFLMCNYCCKKFCWKASLPIPRLFCPKLRTTDSLIGLTSKLFTIQCLYVCKSTEHKCKNTEYQSQKQIERKIGNTSVQI